MNNVMMAIGKAVMVAINAKYKSVVIIDLMPLSSVMMVIFSMGMGVILIVELKRKLLKNCTLGLVLILNTQKKYLYD